MIWYELNWDNFPTPGCFQETHTNQTDINEKYTCVMMNKWRDEEIQYEIIEKKTHSNEEQKKLVDVIWTL